MRKTIIGGWSKKTESKPTEIKPTEVILAGWLEPKDAIKNPLVTDKIDVNGHINIAWTEEELPEWTRQADCDVFKRRG